MDENEKNVNRIFNYQNENIYRFVFLVKNKYDINTRIYRTKKRRFLSNTNMKQNKINMYLVGVIRTPGFTTLLPQGLF